MITIVFVWFLSYFNEIELCYYKINQVHIKLFIKTEKQLEHWHDMDRQQREKRKQKVEAEKKRRQGYPI